MDATSYVATDVSSGVVVSGDTGSYPLDIDLKHKGVLSTKSSEYAGGSPEENGHATENTDVMTTV